jgi:D-glycero-D-manno-heptose 1,7-bisphosphate phosphatase
MRNKGLFLDLDGTIITTKSSGKFPIDEFDWKFLPRVLEKIKFYSDQGYIICITSNQGGVEIGRVTKEAIDRKLDAITKEIEAAIRTDVNTVYCPNMNGYHRKPNPGQAYTLALQLEIDLSDSIMVSDFKRDEEFAKNAGIGTFMWASDFTQYYQHSA